MKKYFLTIIIFCSLIFLSCRNKVHKHNINYSPEINKTEEKEFFSTMDNNKILKIFFSELTVSLPKSIILLNETIIDASLKDSVNIILEMGEMIEGQLIEVITDDLSDIEIEQCYETSITVMNEGPHCDLTDWKHYLSDWVKLKKNNNNQFISYTYEENAKEIFSEIDIEELKDAVLEHCGERWYDLIKEKSSLKEYPFGVGISRYFFRITGYNKKGIISKIITLENPMGC